MFVAAVFIKVSEGPELVFSIYLYKVTMFKIYIIINLIEIRSFKRVWICSQHIKYIFHIYIIYLNLKTGIHLNAETNNLYICPLSKLYFAPELDTFLHTFSVTRPSKFFFYLKHFFFLQDVLLKIFSFNSNTKHGGTSKQWSLPNQRFSPSNCTFKYRQINPSLQSLATGIARDL